MKFLERGEFSTRFVIVIFNGKLDVCRKCALPSASQTPFRKMCIGAHLVEDESTGVICYQVALPPSP